MNRRSFLKRAVMTAVAPSIIRSTVLGGEAGVSASERITLGVIGTGNRCRDVLQHFLLFPEVQCLAVCDVQQGRLAAAKATVDQHHGNQDCKPYLDFHELLGRDDLDAVLVATGDRLHAVISIEAAKAGKDIYSEKPMSLTIEEGRALVEATKRFGTVYQCGHQRRSVDSYRFQMEVAQSGRIGKVHTVIAQMWENSVVKPQPAQPVPAGFDYERWLGPTPWHPFVPARVFGWNDFWDTGGGSLIGMGCHYTDIAQWGLDTDHTGPVRYAGTAEFAPNNFADVPKSAHVTCTYGDGVKLELHCRGAFVERYIRFVGPEGWVQVDDETNVVTAEPKSILKVREISARSWAHAGNHIGNFLNCVRTRQETVCSAEKSHRATIIGHVANICIRLGRALEWNPETERFNNDPEANRMISRAMRPPWHL